MDNVLETIARSNRPPVLFIGSGISKRYLFNYPSWEQLLELSFAKFDSDTFHYQKYIDQCRRKGMTDFEINTYMGSLIEEKFNEAFFDRKVKIGKGNNKNPSWVKRGISPYKMFLTEYFAKLKLNRKSGLAEELEKFRALKNKITAVITTNYDSFLENVVFPEDYTVFVHQHELFSDDSYNIAEIYKIHGSISDANSIVITREDYNKFKETRKLIIAKMLILFAEAPIVFMGYSFTDENVKEIIEDFLGCLSEEQRKDIRTHFVFVSRKTGEDKLLEVDRTITTKHNVEIPFVEIQTDNFGLIFETLGKITPGISPVKVRETRRVIKRIVDQSVSTKEAESVIVGIDELADLDLSSKPLAIAIGYKDSILSKYGYGRFDDKLIFEDIIYNNKRFDPEAMCNERLFNIVSTRLMPVFKYVKDINIPEGSKLYNYMQAHNSEDKIISSTVRKELKNIPEFDGYDLLMANVRECRDFRKKGMTVLKNVDKLTVDELRRACEYLFENLPEDFNQTYFKRCVMCLDLRENKK